MKNKFLLVDGNALIFRAFYSSYGRATLTTKSGIPTNAVFSFINMLMNIIEKNDYFCVKVAFDKGKKTFRHEKLKDYKAGRAKTPSELVLQFPIVREFLTNANIEWFEVDNYEADDIIGSITKTLESNKEAETHILTSDQDMYQLISDKTFVLSPQIGTSELVVYNREKLFDKWGVTPEQVIDYKGLRGDSSDNIKGVAGIGEKTAKDLLQEFHTLENIYNNLEKIKGAKQAKLISGKEDAFLSKEIATIYKDMELNKIDFNKTEINFEALKNFFIKYEMNSLLKKYSSKNSVETKEEKLEYIVLNKWEPKYSDSENYIYLETLNDNYHTSDVIGIAIANSKGNFYYSFNTSETVDIFNWNNSVIDEQFQIFLKNSKFKTYDVKKTIIALMKMGYQINPDLFIYDMMIACYVINSNVKSTFDQHIIMIDPSIETKTFEEIFGKGVKKTQVIDEKVKMDYIVNKVLLIKKDEQEILKLLKDNNQMSLYEKIEFEFAKVLIDMEIEGIQVDRDELAKQEKNILQLLVDLELDIKDDLKEYIDKDFNLASPKQLKELLFEKLKLPDYNKGSTDRETLDYLEDKHPVISKIIAFRKYNKLHSTYLKGFEKFIHPDNKVHTIFNQTLTNTGRLSSSYPNIQNISVRDEEQKNVRKIFVTKEDNVYLSFDYSQIELRVLADIVNEKKLVEIFSMNRDIHSEAARSIFKLNQDEKISSEQRRVAKVFNFGILYGLSDFGLAKDLKISIPQAKEYIKTYYEAFPQILKFKEEVIKLGYEKGYVETLGNRRRYIYELSNTNYMVKQFGERAAVNAPIQGTAADILKVAMINVFKNLKSQKLQSKMIAQIHDEIILLVKKQELEEVKTMVLKTMQEAYNDLLKIANKNREALVELEINYSQANDWFNLK
ncbi:DNA polymerase I [Spiroplasma cantharicola]|uniref:DNA polymerase I n=1 Tax=Spiroplasma cantharicola TaxID=362837 RepID=A0A0M3SJH9_9MOLU|nr:DNA polymerase I [Spiroplasma cantharicola]ALD66764.1 DNA polymerase I [Spiroplasma cantharicola]